MRRIMTYVGTNRDFKAWLLGMRSGMVIELSLYRWRSAILKRFKEK